MIAIIPVGFITTLLFPKVVLLLSTRQISKTLGELTLEVVAIFLPLLHQSSGKLWPHHFQAVKTQSAGLYLKFPLY